jgi:hypothetical protein
METNTVCIVTSIDRGVTVKINGRAITILTVHARLSEPGDRRNWAPQWTKILKPIRLRAGQPEIGALMEQGEFMFETIDEVKVGTKITVLISPLLS